MKHFILTLLVLLFSVSGLSKNTKKFSLSQQEPDFSFQEYDPTKPVTLDPIDHPVETSNALATSHEAPQKSSRSIASIETVSKKKSLKKKKYKSKKKLQPKRKKT